MRLYLGAEQVTLKEDLYRLASEAIWQRGTMSNRERHGSRRGELCTQTFSEDPEMNMGKKTSALANHANYSMENSNIHGSPIYVTLGHSNRSKPSLRIHRCVACGRLTFAIEDHACDG